MRIAVAADHAGDGLKGELISWLRAREHQVDDLGTHGPEPVDYPDLAVALGRAIVDGAAERGVLICGSGVGASVAAKKLPGIRAGLCHDSYSAHEGVEHDDIDVLVLGRRVIGAALARELVEVFLAARHTREERHERRVAKVRALEQGGSRAQQPGSGPGGSPASISYSTHARLY